MISIYIMQNHTALYCIMIITFSYSALYWIIIYYIILYYIVSRGARQLYFWQYGGGGEDVRENPRPTYRCPEFVAQNLQNRKPGTCEITRFYKNFRACENTCAQPSLRNGFPSFLRDFSENDIQDDEKTTGFIRVPRRRFPVPRKPHFTKVF